MGGGRLPKPTASPSRAVLGRDSGPRVHAYTVDVIGSIPVGPTLQKPVILREFPPFLPGNARIGPDHAARGIPGNLERMGAFCCFAEPMESP